MKLVELINAYNGFKEMGNLILSTSDSYDIGMIMKELRPYVETFEEQRAKKIIELGNQQDDGSYTVLPENKQKFLEEMIQLENKKIEFNLKYPKIKLNKNNNLQAKIIWSVMDFIELIE